VNPKHDIYLSIDDFQFNLFHGSK